MLVQTLRRLYRQLRLQSYRSLFGSVQERSGSLSATEAFSADVIQLLGTPTLSQFAHCLGISQPNATYKINSLVAKGYVEKRPSPGDRREVRLCPAEKLKMYRARGEISFDRAVEALKRRFTPNELDVTARVLSALLDETEKEELK